ncbi:tRNA 2-thiouridine(34) synthase MnmA [Elioraea rosea]|uniref:tRNA 2-thiouridine(34) synthase MnmA n=1 Tax=Elioraea rosea TaxID=2492390 RepID=UPI0011849651|nr:tRNA 2-thiouridine(34) synthase MnmA [Elioraea rosea]
MRVVVAMSGGVDSSVVAALMAEAGHEVIGITLQLYDHGAAVGRKGACCAGQDIHDARRVADRLGIDHYVLDMEARFRAAVIADFADSYARGETPIPCVRCNQKLKFVDLLAVARDLGADALATGHYARIVEDAGEPALAVAADAARDQSYFLFATRREDLAFLRFPLGDMTKDRVRSHATRLGLPVADKPDSQDICFVPSGSYADLVTKLRPEAAESGEIVTEDGRVLGRHRGIARYTVGQAKGLGEASRDGEQRMHVLRVESGARRVVVGPRAALGRNKLEAGEVNWLIEPPASPLRCAAKLRGREAPAPASVRWDGSVAHVTMDAPATVAPGQAAVFYDGPRVLGGGFIRAA